MAIIYRLEKAKHIKSVLSGEGARLLGGRWNFPGTSLIYSASSTSLAILESSVHLERLRANELPPRLMVVLNIPDESIHEFAVEDLPEGWDEVPVSEVSQQFLSAWLEPGNKLAYSVPP